jgi:hypothetical protein
VNLVDAKKKKTYLIVPGGISLKPGERVRLRGRKSKDKNSKELGSLQRRFGCQSGFRFALKAQAP